MRVKICGITNVDDAEAALAAGAWAIGLNNHPESPRRCDADLAAQIGARLRRRCEVAGVFVEATLDELALAAEQQALTILQLHGDHGPAFCREAARRTGCRIIKAFQVRGAAEVAAARAFRTEFHLFDAPHDRLRGGTGETANWEAIGARRTRVPALLAGGLTTDNLPDAIATARPFAVDVASGIEAEPGRKDHAAMRAFIATATEVGPENRADRRAVVGRPIEPREEIERT